MPKSYRKRKYKTKDTETETEEQLEQESHKGKDTNSEFGKQCDVCTLPHSTEDCPLINTGVRVQDALLPKKAFLTLPSSLESQEESDGKIINVVSKYGLAKGTQFGPLDAPKTSQFNTKCPYLLKVFKGSQTLHFLDTSDQDKCNWMTLVRFTQDPKVRNCICYQLKNEIYFSVVDDIPPGQSLVVSYSPGYSAQLEKNQQLASTSILSREPESAKPLAKSKSKSIVRPIELPSTSQDEIDIKLHSEIKIEPVVIPENYDHDYVAPTLGDNNLKSSDELKVRRSTRKRKAPIIPDFDFGKPRKANVTNESSSQSDEDDVSDDGDSLKSKKPGKRKGQRLYAVRALDQWICKFCRDTLPTMESFALHLTEHYKKVGAARTEKERIKNSDPLNPKHVPVKETVPNVSSAKTSQQIESDTLDETETRIKEDSKEEVEDVKIDIEPSYPYECCICIKFKIFNRAEYLIRHLRLHTGEIFCYECNEKFSTKEEQLIHKCSASKVKEDEPKICTICDKTYCSYANLRQHLRMCHGKSFKCRTCRRVFNTDEGLKNHECKPKKGNSRDNDVKIMQTCCICDSAFSSVAAFEKHLTCHDKTEFTCTVCDKILSNDTLKIHVSVCKVLQNFLDRETEDLTCPCHKCEKSFGDLQEFKDHTSVHTHPFMCPSCNVRLKTADEIRYHSCEKLVCDENECEGTFSSLNELRSHIVESHGGPQSYCFECAFPFATTDGYIKHGDCELRRLRNCKPKPAKFGKSQKGDGMFICEVCGAFYSKWSSMKTHRYTHGPKKYACEKCGKSFHRKELLADHVFVHQEPQFACDRCEKKFKSKKSLEVHSRIHDNIKPFSCLTCGRSFTQKVNLRSHEMTHVPEDQKGFPCHILGCLKTFFSKEYLKFHIESHENGTRFSCDVCGKQYVRMHMLNQHKRTAHGDHKYKCEFCVPVLHLRQKHSLLRHLKKRHQNYREVWSEEGYGDKMFIAGDGNFTHPSQKNRMATRHYPKTERNSSSDEEVETEIQEHADMTVMISGSMEDGTEEIEIETQEEEEMQAAGSHELLNASTSMVLLHVDSAGRYVLAFPNTLQKSEDVDGEEQYVMEEISTFE